jgi:hypothetical protein
VLVLVFGLHARQLTFKPAPLLLTAPAAASSPRPSPC